jgi:hypothetical protein
MAYTKHVLLRYSGLVAAMGAKGPLSFTVLRQQFNAKEQGLILTSEFSGQK